MDGLLILCQQVIDGYEEKITIRHLFYRLAGMRAIEKSEEGYKNLCGHLSKWRKQRKIAFNAFIDGTRWHYGVTTYDDAQDALADSVRGYRKNLWDTQECHVEVWAEKDAIASIVHPISDTWGLKTFICRGFASISSLYNAAEIFNAKRRQGKIPHILYLGDHDPSGKAIDEAISKAWRDFGVEQPIFKRVAVLPEHIDQYNLMTRPVKASDTRARGWQGGCVEVDTLTPAQLRSLLEKELESLVDPFQWEQTKRIERAESDALGQILANSRGYLMEAGR